MSEECSISFEVIADGVTFVTAGGEHLGEIAIDDDGEAQIDFDTCWLRRADLEAIVKKMRELEAENEQF